MAKIVFERESQALTWARKTVKRTAGIDLLPSRVVARAARKVAKLAWRARSAIPYKSVQIVVWDLADRYFCS